MVSGMRNFATHSIMLHSYIKLCGIDFLVSNEMETGFSVVCEMKWKTAVKEEINDGENLVQFW